MSERSVMSAVARAAAAAWKPPDRRTPWEWCEDNVVVDPTSPMPGKWRSENSPWVRPVMEAWGDNLISDVSVMCSAQSSKTQTLMCALCWTISEDPGPGMWVMAASDEAGQFVRDRIGPTFAACKPVKAVMLGESRLEYSFATMPFYFTGAGSPSKLQSKPLRWLILDEVRNYPPGALETVLKRTRAFWNSRRAIVSTPGMKNDAVHRAFLAGDQRVFHVECPKCRQLQPLKFDQLKWDTNEQTKPGGTWDWEALAQSIRFECAACQHPIRDRPAERKALARGGRFVRMNPHAPRNKVSFHWNALLPPWVSWRSIVEEFIAARKAARNGDIQPMKTFVNETLGEPWEDRLGEIEDFGFLEHRKEGYAFGEAWADEQTRFMAADKQAKGGEHYWWLIRAFNARGASRLVSYGRANTTAELEDIRKQHNVPKANAVIDSGYKATEVYKFCLGTGWKPFKGEDREWFYHKDEAGNSFRRLFDTSFVDPAQGTKAQGRMRLKLYLWSNPTVRDLLTEHMTGLLGHWSLPQEVGRDYLRQVTAHVREALTDTLGRTRHVWRQRHEDDHLGDCELMLLTVAVITGLVKGGTQVAAPKREQGAQS